MKLVRFESSNTGTRVTSLSLFTYCDEMTALADEAGVGVRMFCTGKTTRHCPMGEELVIPLQIRRRTSPLNESR